jgi:hypothetical protein
VGHSNLESSIPSHRTEGLASDESSPAVELALPAPLTTVSRRFPRRISGCERGHRYGEARPAIDHNYVWGIMVN